MEKKKNIITAALPVLTLLQGLSSASAQDVNTRNAVIISIPRILNAVANKCPQDTKLYVKITNGKVVFAGCYNNILQKQAEVPMTALQNLKNTISLYNYNNSNCNYRFASTPSWENPRVKTDVFDKMHQDMESISVINDYNNGKEVTEKKLGSAKDSAGYYKIKCKESEVSGTYITMYRQGGNITVRMAPKTK
jgi:hypothetical protein